MSCVEILERIVGCLVGVKFENLVYFFSLWRVFGYVRNMFVILIWVSYFISLQIGIYSYCSLWQGGGRGCICCSVKFIFGWKLLRGWMLCEVFEFVVWYWFECGVFEVVFYINGEFCLDERVYWFGDVCQRCGLIVVIDIDGFFYDFCECLVYLSSVQVRFSYLVLIFEVYEKVYGKDLFCDVIVIVRWFLRSCEEV